MSRDPLPPGQTGAVIHRVGTLTYTKAGLFTLFAWLLWGDFSFSLMETVWVNVLPLQLQSLDTPNTVISLMLTTLPSVMNFVLNPIISTASDRHRGKRGRRIPFLLFATPFVTVMLTGLGFSKQIGTWLHTWIGSSSLDPATLTIGLIAVLIALFRFFELFINTVYWYLFNDVVPEAMLGRFLALFRVIGSLAGALFHFFIFRYASSHATEILVGTAILYGCGFFLMCLNVKEGEYPPPDVMVTKQKSPFAYLKAFGKQCFSHRIFILLYLSSATWAFVSAIGPFQVFFMTSLGISLGQLGAINGCATFASMLLLYPAGLLVDRFHPTRVMLGAKLGLVLITPLAMVYLFLDVPPETAFYIQVGLTVISTPLTVIFTAASLPLLMRLMPGDKFGQFSSANAMCSALALTIGGIAGGLFLDGMKHLVSGSSYYYRFIPVWNWCGYVLSLGCTVMVYREWLKLGGDKAYQPPNADAKNEPDVVARA